jgi:hypothetical protein
VESLEKSVEGGSKAGTIPDRIAALEAVLRG